MVVENALAKERGCYISDARYELDDLYLEQDKMFLAAITPPDMYANFKSDIAFLSTMIENANGRDVSGPRDELIKLLDEQIALAEKLCAESLEKVEEWSEAYPDLLEDYKQNNCEYAHQNCLQWKSDIEEEERKAEVYWNDLKVVREQKKL